MKTSLMQVVEEMMKTAAESIAFEHCEENVDQIINDLLHDHNIDLTKSQPITTGLVSTICDCIQDWQRNTLLNQDY